MQPIDKSPKQTSKDPSANRDHSSGVIVMIDGERMTLTREQEALIRSWAAGPV